MCNTSVTAKTEDYTKKAKVSFAVFFLALVSTAIIIVMASSIPGPATYTVASSDSGKTVVSY